VIERAAWSFLYGEEFVAPLAAFRILLGILLLIEARLVWYDREILYGADGVLPANVFAAWGKTSHSEFEFRAWVKDTFRHAAMRFRLFYWLHVGSIVFLTLGLFTRAAVVMSWLTFRVVLERNPVAVGGPEATYRNLLLLLALSPCGLVASCDSLLQSGTLNLAAKHVAWPLQLLRFQVSWIIFNAAWNKLLGGGWRNGSAIYVLLKTASLPRELAPIGLGTGAAFPRTLQRPWVFNAMTYVTVLAQLVCPPLLWVDATRHFAMMVLIAQHGCMQVFVSVGMYQPLMIVGLLLFVDANRA
jgi:hypothetical protein